MDFVVEGECRNWQATVFSGNNIIGEVEAVSEKQAHFLVAQQFPGAKSPAQVNREKDQDYYSANDYRWRAKQGKNHE